MQWFAGGMPRLLTGLAVMHLSGTLLIIAALVAAESGVPGERWLPAPNIGLMLLGCLLVMLAAAAISGTVAAEIRGNPSSVRSSLCGYARLRRVHTGLWLIVSAVGVLVLQWPQWMAQSLQPQFILLDEVAVLLPVLAPMFFSYAAFFEVDRVAAVALRGGSAPRDLPSRWSYAWWFVRHEFGLVVGPLLILVLVRDVADACLGPAESALAGWFVGLGLVAVLLGFPLLMRYIWYCRPLEDEGLRSSIAGECRIVGQRPPKLLEWNTQGRVVNAVVTGTLPGTHCVLLSDMLLKHFSRAEILAILRHELAHARQHHVLLRVAALALPLVVCWAMGLDPWIAAAYGNGAGLGPMSAWIWVSLAVASGLAAYVYYVFGAFSRLLELEADLLSCGQGEVDPERALAAETALYKLGCVYGLDRSSWLHPPMRLRLHVLAAAARDRSVGERVLRQTRGCKLAVVAALMAALLLAACVG